MPIDQSARTETAAPAQTKSWVVRVAAIAGIAYSATWIAGLAVWPTNLDVRATGPQVLDAYQGHQFAASIQAVLVHGAAGISLGIVALALALTVEAHEPHLATVARIAALGAAATSLVQMVFDLSLAGPIASGGHIDSAGSIMDTINRLDGVKMLFVAIFAGAVFVLARNGLIPRWIGAVAIVLAGALAVSGVGYLGLVAPLAAAAFVSGPLLLVVITSIGIWCGRSSVPQINS